MSKKNVKFDILHKEYEAEGKLNEITIPSNTHNAVTVDENYDFEQRGFFKKIAQFLIGLLTRLGGPILNWILFGVRFKGRKNLKALKKTGFIGVSNHVLFLDNLLIRQAIYFTGKRLFITVAPHNCKRGIGGAMMRAGGIVPIPLDHPNALKQFNKKVHSELSKGNCIHFYPEQSLWFQYSKPRPLLKGAFTYAAKENVPVVPMFLTFKETHGLRKLISHYKRVTVNILEPIFPDPDKTRGENTSNMQKAANDAMLACYRQTYDDCRECIYDFNEEAMQQWKQQNSSVGNENNQTN